MRHFFITMNFVFNLPFDYTWHFLGMTVLLLLSAAFSGTETAIFSLTTAELNRIRSDNGRLSRTIVSLHRDLSRLLLTMLFGNMAVNILFFAITTVLTAEISPEYGGAISFYFGLIGLFVVVFFGEVLPKQIALVARVPLIRITAFPLLFLHRILAKPLELLNDFVIVTERVFEIKTKQHKLREEELFMLREFSKSDGIISNDEYELIDSIVDLPSVRIRDIMLPRVDIVSVTRDSRIADVLALVKKKSHIKIPVFDHKADDYIGWIDAREAVQNRTEAALDKFIKPLFFLSEHDKADQVLGRFRNDGDQLAMVVDERGVIVGMITRQDILDEIFGCFGDYGAAPPEPIRNDGDGYILAGSLSVREWKNLFKVSGRMPKSASVGGLVTSLLNRPARAGDKVYLDNMELKVLSVKRNRVNEVKVRLANNAEADKSI